MIREIRSRAGRHANCCTVVVLHHHPTRAVARPFDVLQCSRGDAAVEYVVLLGTMAIPLVPVLVAFGVWMVETFESMRNLLVLPFP